VEDDALIWGATALVAFFLLTLPLVVARLAFPVQLQISRVFWLVDVLATIYLLSLLVDRRVARAVAIALVIVSVSRGAYIMLVERPDRSLFSMRPGGVTVGGRHALAIAPTGCHACARRSGALVEVRDERARVRHARCLSWKT
jgi:hypothetical protein